MELEAQRKDKERPEEEVTEEPERPRTQEMAGEYSSLEEALLAFEAQDPNVERCRKVAAAVQNAVQRYSVIHDEKKKSYHTDITGPFFKRADRIESSQEPELVPSTSCMSETAACPPSPPVADGPSALLSPLPHPVSNSFCLFT